MTEYPSGECRCCETLADRIKALEQQRDELLSAAERCYRVLLTEPNTNGALFRAENILREMIANAKESK